MRKKPSQIFVIGAGIFFALFLFIGIGHFALGAALTDVHFLGGAPYQLISDGAGTFNIVTTSTTGGAINISSRALTSGLFLDVSNNVGVGTTTPATKLHIIGSSTISGNLAVNGNITGTFTGTNSGATLASSVRGGGSVFGSSYDAWGTNYRFNDATNTALLFIDATNSRVGIGLANPSARLHLQGNNTNTDIIVDPLSSGGGDASLRLVRNGIGSEELRLIAAAGGASGGNNLYLLDLFGNPNARDLQIRSTTNGGASYNNLVKFTATGNVGIGTTNPLYRLNIQGTGATSSMIAFNNSGNPVPYVGIGYNQTADGLAFMYNQSTSDLNGTGMFMDRTGKVGIGTVAPAVNLEVTRALNDGGTILRLGNAPTTAFDFARNNTTGALSIQGLQTGFNNIVLAPTSGNVSIGSTTSVYKLDVFGTTRTMGLLVQNGGTNMVQISSSDNGGNAGVYFSGAGDRGSIYGNGNYVIYIEPNAQYGNGHVVINSKNGSGNLGVGTSTLPTTARLVLVPGAQPSIDAGSQRIINVAVPLSANDAANKTYVDSAILTATSSNVGVWSTNGANIYNSNTGNVGIGTSTPNLYKLQVAGTLGADSGNIFSDGVGNLNAISYYDKSNPIYFLAPSAATALKVNGTISSGVSGTAGAQLHVNFSSNSTPAGLFVNGGGAGEGLRIQAGGGGSAYSLFNAALFDGTSKFYVRGDGNVGMATTTPADMFTMVRDAAGIRISSYTDPVNYYTRFINNWSSSDSFDMIGAGGVKFLQYNWMSPAVVSFFPSVSGNVGIDTATPQSRLDVNGGVAVGSYAGLTAAPSNSVIVSGSVGIGTSTPQDKLAVAGGYVSDITGRVSRNLLDTNTWTVSNATIGNWISNQSSAGESQRAWDTDPFGRPALVWEDVTDGVSDPSGGWTYSNIPIDNNKAYRLTVWFKRSAGTLGNLYLGASGTNTNNLDGTANNNPYFLAPSAAALIAGRWYLFVGYIHAANDPSLVSYSGVYDGVTGQRVLPGTDFKNAGLTNYQVHRSFSYYNTGVGSVNYQWGPRFEQIDGSEPSVEALLGNDQAATLGSNAYFGGNVGIGTTTPATALSVVGTTTVTGNLNVSGNITGTFTGTNSGATLASSVRGNGSIFGSSYDGTTGTNYRFNDATSSVLLMVDATNSRIGVGTAVPWGAFHVNGSGISQNNWIYFSNNVGTGAGTPSASALYGMMLGWNPSGGSGESQILYGTGAGVAPRLDFGRWDGTTKTIDMTLKAGGLGIGTTAPAYSLDVYNGARIGKSVGSGDGFIFSQNYLMHTFNGEVNPRMIYSRDINPSGGVSGTLLFNQGGGTSYGVYGGGIGQPAANSIALFAGNGASLQERMRIDPNGNVGIGTSTPQDKFTVMGNMRMNADSGAAYVKLGSFNFVRSNYDPTGVGASIDFWRSGSAQEGILAFSTNPGVASGQLPTERMRVDYTGNIGIGTATTTGARVVIAPGSQPSIDAGSQRIINVAVPTAATDAATKTYVDSAIAVATSTTSQWGTNGTHIYNSNTGNVGVGTSTPTAYKLQVAGSFGSDSGNLYTDGLGNLSATSFIDKASPTYFLQPSAAVSLKTAGSVGIGMAGTPVSALHVAGTTGLSWGIAANSLTQGLVTIGTAGTGGSSLMVNTPSLNSSYGSGLGVDGSYTNPGGIGTSIVNLKALGVYSGGGYDSAMAFYTSLGTVASEKMRITSLGYVGIGTSTPGANMLYVNGATLINGTLNMNNNNISSINKLSVAVIDPLYNIGGKNYSTYAASIAGGVKEEYVGRARLTRNDKGQMTNDKVDNSSAFDIGNSKFVIDFTALEPGSDLWLWYQAVDFSRDNVEVLATAYSVPTSIAYEINGTQIIFRAHEPVEFSYRLIGKRHDWKAWPTFAKDQTEKASFTINEK